MPSLTALFEAVMCDGAGVSDCSILDVTFENEDDVVYEVSVEDASTKESYIIQWIVASNTARILLPVVLEELASVELDPLVTQVMNRYGKDAQFPCDIVESEEVMERLYAYFLLPDGAALPRIPLRWNNQGPLAWYNNNAYFQDGSRNITCASCHIRQRCLHDLVGMLEQQHPMCYICRLRQGGFYV